MAKYAFAIHIVPGKTENLKTYMRQIRTSHWDEFKQSRKNMGVHSAQFWLQETPNGDMGIVSLDVDNPAKFYEILMKSDAPFDVWFREKILMECQGISPNGPTPKQNELLLDFGGQVQPATTKAYEKLPNR